MTIFVQFYSHNAIKKLVLGGETKRTAANVV
jgi:hypothetical protein